MASQCQQDVTIHDKAVLDRIFNPSLPYGDVVEEVNQQEEVHEPVATNEMKEAKRLEIAGIQEAEKGEILNSLELFGQAIQIAPNFASAYNNRAQALRLNGDVEGAMHNLNKAIELSDGRGTVACQAYTQRALIRRLEGNDDEAKQDLTRAANLGGHFAKQLLVSMNPYAALCNQMLAEVIIKLRSAESTEETYES
ncbi:hypothetical protein CHS0354_016382 [Potamilus streckersoni]|uniref:Tetratricopeptide repeat protein 36 n=1 Tax=Potamilus streckersoni TaxID=2493646 RepID=A0AAE0SWN6_9BIVA|nr:hypothetical protein CHS0354_016382 [Potamilus streckersoni]